MNMEATIYILIIAWGYLLGSIPFGKLVGKLYGIDIQRRGSGNIGFANVRRVLGWKAGILTLTGDILKGFIPTLLVLLTTNNTNLAYFTGLAAVLGHIFPVWLKFRGGKGIATGLGLVTVINPIAAAIGSAVYISGCLVFKRSSTASILGVFSVAITASLISPELAWQYILLLAIALWTLRNNLRGTVPDYDI